MIYLTVLRLGSRDVVDFLKFHLISALHQIFSKQVTWSAMLKIGPQTYVRYLKGSVCFALSVPSFHFAPKTAEDSITPL